MSGLPSNISLVKYDTPILVSTSFKGKSPKKGKKLAPIEKPGGQSQTEDVLNSILPPKESTENGQLKVQYVKSTPATKAEVIQLQEDLDRLLQERQARETGICPIREELYAQCFDELIRQVTIICTERGMLLLRVRDELRMTIQSYQTLYESSIAFGMRKALQAEQRKAEVEALIKGLESDIISLQRDDEALDQEIKDLEIREKEQQELEERRHNGEVEFRKKTNQHLKDQLESLLATPKK